MDISLTLDQIQCCRRFACSLIKTTNSKQKIPSYDDFPLKKRCRAPFAKFRCSLLDHGLRPRPMPKPLEKEEKSFRKSSPFEETHLKNSNSSSGIYGQIKKLVLCKRYNEAPELFEILECKGEIDVKSDTYDALVAACIGLRSIRDVKRVFSHMINSGVDLNLYMMNRVLLMHVNCGMIIDARHLFDEMAERNVVSSNTITGGFVDSGDYTEAFKLFLMMSEGNSEVGIR